MAKSARAKRPGEPLAKWPTGIAGFDVMSAGGLTRGRSCLILGGPGSGKTVFALQLLVNAARNDGESGIFVTFEERVGAVIENHRGFDWDLDRLAGHKIHFIEAQLPSDAIATGEFDILGLLSALDGLIRSTGATRIIFDAVDILLSRLPSEDLRRREIARLHSWLLASGLAGLITAKTDFAEARPNANFEPLAYMTDGIILMHHRLDDRATPHGIQIVKYRGSRHMHGEFPFLITPNGIEVQAYPSDSLQYEVSDRRVGTGIPRLDQMLDGGYYAGSSILISGAPGTAKTTLAGAFALAAVRRGERMLYLSFDEAAEQIVRNLRSVSIDLMPFLKNGRLRFAARRIATMGLEEHYLNFKALVDAFEPQAVVVDPVSALIAAGGSDPSTAVVQRMIDLAKSRNVTILCTSLLTHGADEASAAHVSTIVDTWIQLSYAIRAGERNRALTVIKSRGMAHSNQVRELLLSSDGLALADLYTASGEVLMGTARAEHEASERAQARESAAVHQERQLRLKMELAEFDARLHALQAEITGKRMQLETNEASETNRLETAELRRSARLRRRGGTVKPSAPTTDQKLPDRPRPSRRKRAGAPNRHGRDAS